MAPICVTATVAFIAGYAACLYIEYRQKKKAFEEELLEENKRNDINIEAVMPYESVLRDLHEYDASKPKQDEILFIRKLQEKYQMDRSSVLKRIRELTTLHTAKAVAGS